ncbi:MAG: hypothetical protein ABIO44_10435 [Saprospiraceae bacterium]
MEKYQSKYTTYSISEENFVIDEKYIHFQNIILCIDSELENSPFSQFLNQILSASNLKINIDSAIFQLTQGQEVNLTELKSTEIINILAFGIKPYQLKLNGFEELHKVYKVLNYNILFALPIKEYIENKTNKSVLWSAIQVWKNIVPSS